MLAALAARVNRWRVRASRKREAFSTLIMIYSFIYSFIYSL